MRRHGWALSLGLLFGGTIAAQPPADSERFPPAPELPGTIVSKPVGGARPVASVGQVPVRTASRRTSELDLTPKVESKPRPYSPIVTATSAAIETPLEKSIEPAATPTKHGAAGWDGPKWHSGDHGDFSAWLKFRSQSKGPGCVPTPFTPSLQAWFPCDAKKSCCPTNSTVVGSNEMPASQGKVVGTLIAPEPDVKPEPRKVSEGLSFTSGAAPMAAPTTQTGKSTWRAR